MSPTRLFADPQIAFCGIPVLDGMVLIPFHVILEEF